MRRDYLRRQAARMHPETMEMGWPFNFVTQKSVRDQKDRVDIYVRVLDDDVARCTDLPPAIAKSWNTFSQIWRKFCDSDESWWGVTQEMDTAQNYEKQVQNWQKVISSHMPETCKVTAPGVTRLDETQYNLLGGTAASGNDMGSTIKIVLIAGAVIAGAVALKAAVS